MIDRDERFGITDLHGDLGTRRKQRRVFADDRGELFADLRVHISSPFVAPYQPSLSTLATNASAADSVGLPHRFGCSTDRKKAEMRRRSHGAHSGHLVGPQGIEP
jgi:hypothetical protein